MSLHADVKQACGLNHAEMKRHAWTSTTKLPGNHP